MLYWRSGALWRLLNGAGPASALPRYDNKLQGILSLNRILFCCVIAVLSEALSCFLVLALVCHSVNTTHLTRAEPEIQMDTPHIQTWLAGRQSGTCFFLTNPCYSFNSLFFSSKTRRWTTCSSNVCVSVCVCLLCHCYLHRALTLQSSCPAHGWRGVSWPWRWPGRPWCGSCLWGHGRSSPHSQATDPWEPTLRWALPVVEGREGLLP